MGEDENDGYYDRNYVLEYAEFHGNPTDDVHLFLQDFEAIARYNEQSTDEEKLRTLPKLLKKRALVWYKSLPAEETKDWNLLRAAFIQEFRRNPHKLLTKLSRIKKKPDESIRRYSTRVTKLINKLQLVDELYPQRVKVWWFLRGLPSSIRNYCLQGDYETLEAAVSTAKIYENTVVGPFQDPGNADLTSDYSDIESCSSVGTFISSVVESVDSRAKKISKRKVSSAPGSKPRISSPWDMKTSDCRKDRPLTGFTKFDQKPKKMPNALVVDFGKNAKKPPLSPTRRKPDAERLLNLRLNDPFSGQRRKYNTLQ